MRATTKNYMRAFCALFLLIVSAVAFSAFGQVPDPGTPGPRAVTREEYNFGDTAFTPTDFPGPVELRASIHYPTNLSGGPFPLLVFLHGRHQTCFVAGRALLQWPCTEANSQPIQSYQGYDYASEVLASHGYVVVSISANGVNAVDNSVFDLGALARAELIQKHLDILNGFNTTGGAPFGTKFIGKFNMSQIGTMGHSRGGEGVVRQFVLNNSLGAPYGIKAVFPLAPVDFSRFVVNNAPINVMLPYCDGDVSDLQGVHFYDDARYNVPGDLSPKHYVLVMGANHNFYNTIWSPSSGVPGSVDDFSLVFGGNGDAHCGNVQGNRRLTEAQQRGVGRAYMAAFFRTYVGGETQFIPILTGDAPAPPSAQTNDLFVSYHAPDDPELRLDVNRLLDNTNLTLNTLGGAVTQTGLTPYELCGGEPPQAAVCLPGQPNNRQPHTTPSARSPKRGLSQIKTGWNNFTGSYKNDLPSGARNVSRFEAVQFRVSVNYNDVRNEVGLAQDFRVKLTDASGASASVRVSDVSGALFFPPGSALTRPTPKVVLNTVRVPLSAFGGINLNNVRSVEFTFDERLQGGLLITDVAFASAPR